MLVHPGGPFWANRDLGSWSMPKGLFEPGEPPLAAAKREFAEETGFDIDGDFIDLGSLQQPSRKIVHAWAVEGNIDVSKINSNTFSLEWPAKSGHIKEYPEIDRGEWFSIDLARAKITKGQQRFLDRLVRHVGKKRNKPAG
jgi:predicted NUDIX family NTP pyrophosphohydrolase